jgi:hypothetical protein
MPLSVLEARTFPKLNIMKLGGLLSVYGQRMVR